MADSWHPETVLELLTGSGLAASAGVNAYIPLLVMGLLDRYTGLIELPSGWQWLGNGWVLAILAVLLAVEVVSDTITVSDPDSFFSNHQWIPIVVGMVLAFGVHAIKAAARPVINAMTAGIGAPVVSTVEDAGSVTVSVVAIIVPFLIIFVLLGIVVCIPWLVHRRRRRREQRKAARAEGYQV